MYFSDPSLMVTSASSCEPTFDWYQSNVGSQLDAEVTMSDGSLKYIWMTDLAPAASWTQAKSQVVVPAGAVKISVYHLVADNGWLQTDDYSLSTGAGSGGGGGSSTSFTRGLISVTLD